MSRPIYYLTMTCYLGSFAEDCQLTLISSDVRKSHLPLASMEEEVIGGSGAVGRSVDQNKPSSVFLAFQIESDDGFVYKADN